MIKSIFKKFLQYRFRRTRKKIHIFFSKSMISILGIFASPFISTRIGRKVFFELAPKNHFLLTHTSENIYYIVNSSDEAIGKNVYCNKKSFDSHNLTNALNLISRPKTILIDVGANIGTIGLFGVSKGYFKKCIAFEPEPNNFKILKLNVSLNGLSDKFELKNEALSNKVSSSLELELSEGNYGDHRMKVSTTSGIYNEANRKVISVSVNTLDNALKNINLHECILFMDTQGFEGHVLSGASKLVQLNAPIITEFWPYGLKRAGGLDLFYDTISNSSYNLMWDLKNPKKKIRFSIDEFKNYVSNWKENQHTDFLFVKE